MTKLPNRSSANSRYFQTRQKLIHPTLYPTNPSLHSFLPSFGYSHFKKKEANHIKGLITTTTRLSKIIFKHVPFLFQNYNKYMSIILEILLELILMYKPKNISHSFLYKNQQKIHKVLFEKKNTQFFFKYTKFCNLFGGGNSLNEDYYLSLMTLL